MNNTEKLFSAFPILKKHWEKIFHLIKIQNFNAKSLLLEKGEISDNLYIIIKGCLRLFYIKNDDEEYTSQFFFENQLVSSLESFIEKKPSQQYIETLENSTLCVISSKNVDILLDFHEDFKEMYFRYIRERLIYYSKLHSSFILDSPEDRYQKLLQEYPFIFKRLHQYYIATYLGVTPVSLSRIRSRIKNNQINKG